MQFVLPHFAAHFLSVFESPFLRREGGSSRERREWRRVQLHGSDGGTALRSQGRIIMKEVEVIAAVGVEGNAARWCRSMPSRCFWLLLLLLAKCPFSLR